MERFVLDTNLFFNMEPGLGLGKKTQDVVLKATAGMKKLKAQKKAEFFMPPSIVSEFLSFFEDKNQKFIKDFLAQITTKSPDVSKVNFPAQVFYKLVSEIRKRSYRGLTVAEEELKSAVQEMMGQVKLDKKEFEIKAGKFIKNLRDRFRQATRVGFLDSIADLDLIVLAKELDGFLVSQDEGVIFWGRAFGTKEMDAVLFGKKLT